MIGCEASTRLISIAHERALTVRERFALGLHLLVCGYCRRCRREFAFLASLLRGAVSAGDGPWLFSPVAKERIRRVLRNSGS